MKFSIKNNSILYIGLILAFNLMFINYFTNFNEGSTESGGGLRLIVKIISISLICFFYNLKDVEIQKLNLIFIFVFLFFGVLIAIRLPFNESRDNMFLNTFIALPLLFGCGPRTLIDFKNFDRLILWFFGFWILIDSSLYFTSNTLWYNKAFIGGIGNPSSYGFLLIYIFEVASLEVRNKRFRLIIKIFSFIALLLTQALMPILILLFVQFIKLKKIIIFSTLIIIYFIGLQIDYVLEFLPDEHWKYKLVKLIEFSKTLDYADSSLSISTRIEFFEGVKLLMSDNLTFLFGNVNNTYYNSGDSQYVAYVTSFGVPLFLLFILSLGKLYNRAKSSSLKYFTIAFILILLTNRILDYWPISILIFIFINRVNYEYRNNKQLFT